MWICEWIWETVCLWRRKMGWEVISFVLQTKGDTLPADFFHFWTPCMSVFILGFSTVTVYQVRQLPMVQHFSCFIWLGYCRSKPGLRVCQRWIKKGHFWVFVRGKCEILNIPNIPFTLNEMCCLFYFFYGIRVECWLGVFWLVHVRHTLNLNSIHSLFPRGDDWLNMIWEGESTLLNSAVTNPVISDQGCHSGREGGGGFRVFQQEPNLAARADWMLIHSHQEDPEHETVGGIKDLIHSPYKTCLRLCIL